MNTQTQPSEETQNELNERLNQLSPQELQKELDELLHPGQNITKWNRIQFKLSSLHFNLLVLVGDIRRAVATFKKSASIIVRDR